MKPKVEPLTLTLPEFTKQAWSILEPGTAYVDGWHIGAVCEHLTACSQGHIKNLIINIPPRHMKSLSAAVFWPMWEWTWKPETRWLFSSYAANLSTRDSLKCRQLVESPWYQKNWGSVFQLASDQNQKTRFENTRRGYRIATSVGGLGTGEGGDRIIVDDPHSVKLAESDLQRETTVDWWRTTMSTRWNNPETVVKVIVMQRLHEKDLTGEMLAEEFGYEHLCLPARYDPHHPTKSRTSLHFQDPRTKEGELLWPERVNEEELTRLETQLGEYGTAGQLQQRPAPKGGGTFKTDKITVIAAPPAQVKTRLRWWDTAASEAGDYTAGVLLSIDANNLTTIEDVQMFRLEPGARDARIRQTVELDGRTVPQWFEQEPGSGGKAQVQAFVRMLQGFPVFYEPTSGNKEVNAGPFSAQVNAGNVQIVVTDANRKDVKLFLSQLEQFPNGAHDDGPDAASKAYNKAAQLISQRGTAKAAAPTPDINLRKEKW